MAGKVLAMSKQEEIRRLVGLGLSERSIARALKCSRKTVRKYLQKGGLNSSKVMLEEPFWVRNIDWRALGEEFSSGVPALVLWEELREKGVVPVQYPGFWKQLRRRFPDLPEATMHRIFAPGVRAEIDYSDGIALYDPLTGEVVSTQLFVGVLCHSRFVFAEFSLSQALPDFLSSHVRMFEHFGGVPQLLSPDNLKSAVTKAHRYDPEVNPSYAKLAAYYDCAVVPARVARPKDKAIVERTIQIFQRWFYYRIRHRQFSSLTELHQCLKEHLDIFHQKRHRLFRRSRVEMFEAEKNQLQALPEMPYEVSTHRQVTLHPDCHVMFEKNYYSAPYRLRSQKLDLWASPKHIELYHQNERVAFHRRAQGHSHWMTDSKHYPPEHQAYLEITPCGIKKQASRIGVQCAKLIETLLSGPYPLKYVRRAQGIVRLHHAYSKDQLEKACQRANELSQTSYRFIENLLKRGFAEPRATKKIERFENPYLRQKELFH